MAGMALHRLRLSHFRSHLDLDLALDARPVAIHGPNGAGKTNLIEAISLLSPGRGMRRAQAGELARRPEAVGWRVGAEVATPRSAHEIDTRADGGSRAVRIDGKATPQSALGRILRVLWLVPSMDRLWTEGAEGRRRFLDRLTLGFEPGHGDAVLAWERGMRDRNRLLKDRSDDAGWYDALEARMALAGAAIEASRAAAVLLVAAAQRRAATAFPVAELDIVSPDPGTPDAEGLARALRDGRSRDMAAGRTLTGPHRTDLAAVYADKGMAAAQCSTGEQKALLISLILANARALALEFGAVPIVLLDEVAAHLDADRRAALYDEICAMGAQAWMTGTEEPLFDALGDRARHLRIEDRGGLSITTG